MTALNDGRASFTGDSHERHHAALSGALSAFPIKNGSSERLVVPTSGINYGATKAASAAGRTRSRPHPNAGLTAPTNTFHSPARTHNKSDENLYNFTHRRNLSDIHRDYPPQRSTSPSTTAAKLAASRFHPAPRPKPKAPSARLRSVARASEREQVKQQDRDQEREQLPQHGTVSGVKKWLVSLEGQASYQHLASHSEDTSSFLQHKNPSKSEEPVRSRSALNVLDKAQLKTPARGRGTFAISDTLPKIHSPKPVQIYSSAPSIEKNVSRSSKSSVNALRPIVRHTTSTYASSNMLPLPTDGVTESRASLDSTRSLEIADGSIDRSIFESRQQPALERPSLNTSKTDIDVPHQGLRLNVTGPATLKPIRPTLTGVSASEGRQVEAHAAPKSARHNVPAQIFPVDKQSYFSASAPATASIEANWHQLVHRRFTPHLTGDSLANAMVAGSLASSRAPSPRKLPSPPPRKEKPRRPFQQFKHTQSDTRAKSPGQKGVYTMRRDSTDDEKSHNPFKRSKSLLKRKHPNKHHEGDRKRWRDTVTQDERKRYEGVWAANRGIYVSAQYDHEDVMPQQRAENQVSNVVVRDIWKRSRLPDFALEEVWNLVDRQGTGQLDREEFVVGLWLVDQRLKGRKLPIRVGDSVWRSVTGVSGIKIPRYKG